MADDGATRGADDARPSNDRDHAAELARLEERVRIAERRALDAERRLEELTERVEADRAADEPSDLRARLARTAARKRPAPDDA
jgi:predicted  nucleic acid-binding Zn-ribbon protein